MDVLLISPMEVSLSDKNLFRETNIKSDIENMRANPINTIFVKRSRENLGIEILAAYLRKHGYSVGLINAHTTLESEEIYINKILEINPKVLGISLLYDLHAYNACYIAKKLRSLGYTGHITFGGPFITFAYEYFLAAIDEIDSIIRGEGEIPLHMLTKAIVEGINWKDIPGIAYKEGKQLVLNPPGAILEDLNDMPMPSRDVLQALKDNNVQMRVASFLASRGCNGKCTYCTAPSSTSLSQNYKWRHKSVENVLDELEYIVNEFNIEFVYFCDYNFFGYGIEAKSWLLELAKGILDRRIKIKFHATVRADTKLDTDVLIELKKAGLQYVLLGIESGAQPALDRWNKRTTVEQNKESISIIRNMGFELDPGMILVDAHTTLDEFKDTVKFIEETGIHQCFFPMYLFNQIIAFPGTELEIRLINEGLVEKPDIWEDYGDLSDSENLHLFCKTVSSRPYRIKDPIIESMWTVMTKYTNYVTWIVEDFMPNCLNVWRVGMKSVVKSRELMKMEDKLYLDFIASLRRWRKNLGLLALDILKVSILWGENKTQNSDHSIDELEKNLMKTLLDYERTYFSEVLKKHLENNLNRLGITFSFEGFIYP